MRQLETMADVRACLGSPGTRVWVREQYRAALERDLVDAAQDARLLAKLLDVTLAGRERPELDDPRSDYEALGGRPGGSRFS